MAHKSRQRLACGLCLWVLVLAAHGAATAQIDSASAQVDRTPGQTRLEEMVITAGKGLEAAPSQPATVYDTADLRASGQASVAAFLAELPFASFGNAAPGPGGTAQGQNQMDLRGLGPDRTLVLIDGRRLAGSPITEDAGVSQNLALIPLAAVQRIEVLRSSGAARYGGNAIGGVVNIDLREDFQGIQVDSQARLPTNPGGDQTRVALSAGATSARGSLLIAAESFHREALDAADRAFSDALPSIFSYPANFQRLDPNTGQPLPDPATGGLGSDPRCPEPGSPDPRFPNAAFDGQVCAYNAAAVSTAEGSLHRNSAFAKGGLRLSPSLYLAVTGLASDARSEGQLGPTQLFDPGAPLILSADNPLNPTQNEVLQVPGPDGEPVTVTGPFDLNLFLRNVPGGPRVDTFDDRLLALGTTLSLRPGLGASEFALRLDASRQRVTRRFSNRALISDTQAALASGELDVFGLDDQPDRAAFAALAVDLHDESTSDTLASELLWSWRSARPRAPTVELGATGRMERIERRQDPRLSSGNVFGVVIPEPVDADRRAGAAFASLVWPATGWVSIDAGLRGDTADDFDSTWSGRLGIELVPTRALAVRGHLARGFSPPTLDQLSSPAIETTQVFVDQLGCQRSGDLDTPAPPPTSPCLPQPYSVVSGGNAEIDPELSRSAGLGLTWSPGGEIALSLDYYRIRVRDEIQSPSIEALLAEEAAEGTSASIRRDDQGQIQTVDARIRNVSEVRTSGLDLELRYQRQFGPRTVSVRGLGSHVLTWERRLDDSAAFAAPVGRITPDWRANAELGVSGRRWRALLGAQLIGPATNNFSVAPVRFSTHTTVDARIGVDLFRGRLSLDLGVDNLADEPPPTSDRLTFPFYPRGLYDPYGRTITLSGSLQLFDPQIR